MRDVIARQHMRTDIFRIAIDGSAVTTSENSNAGITYGKHVAKVKKGEGSDSNLVTITLNSALGLAPGVYFQERTLDCICRLEEDTTKDTIKVRTLELDGVSKADNADFEVFVVGTREIREGNYG